jgi:hypothetical protein
MSHASETDRDLVPEAEPKSNLLRTLLIIFVVAPATLVGLGIGALLLLFHFFPMDCGGGGRSDPPSKPVTQQTTKPTIGPTTIPQPK